MSTRLPFDSVMSSPSADMDAAMYEMALARNSAAWMTSATSHSRRPRSTRITKPGSAGNSPQRMPRRRTTTSYRPAKFYPDPFTQPGFNMPDTQNVSPPQNLTAGASSRPLSWHPSSMMSNNPGMFLDYHTPHHRLSMGAYQNADFSNVPNSLGQTSFGGPLDGWSHVEEPTRKLPYEVSQANASPIESTLDEPLYTYPMQLYGQTPYPMASLAPSLAPQISSISPQGYANEAFPSMSTTFYSTIAFTQPPTPDSLPIQQPSDPLVEEVDPSAKATSRPSPGISGAKDEEPELIGMGLYDPPAQTSFLFDGSNSPTQLASSPMGRGLKLEETWEPPSESNSELDSEDDADGEADDGAASEDMDTAFESNESVPSSSLNLPFQHPESMLAGKQVSPLQPPESWSPLRDDMAGQSFFMDDGSPVSLDSEAAQLWMLAMMTHNGAGTALAT